MVISKAKTVKEYLDELPADRRKEIAKVRSVVRNNLPKGFRETINWGMICYEIPLERYRKADDLPLDAIGEIIASTPPDRVIAMYESARGKSKKKS